MSNAILQAVEKEREILAIRHRMNVAEATKAGRTAIVKNSKFDGQKWYAKWWRRQSRTITKLSGKRVGTIWDTLKR